MFTVCLLNTPVRIYKLKYPIYSPHILCQTYLDKEFTVYKHIHEDDTLFESISEIFDPRIYHVFNIYEDCPGIDHIGIVHLISGLFTKHNIPILYMNTYSYNLIFVSEHYFTQAIYILKNQSYISFEKENETEI